MTSNTTTLLLLPLMVVAFYFLLIRPQRKRQQQQQRLLNEMQPGQRVLTHSGIFATLVSVGTKQAVVEVAPGLELTVLKQAIARVTRPEDEDADGHQDAESYPDEPADDTAPQPSTGAAAAGTGAAAVGMSDAGAELPNAYDPYRPANSAGSDLPGTVGATTPGGLPAPVESAPDDRIAHADSDAEADAGIRDVTASYFDRPTRPSGEPGSSATEPGVGRGDSEAGRNTRDR